MWVGSIMPWVDPETIGPQIFSYYAWPFLIFALPNIFLLCAVLFALATLLRSMMAAYIGAIVLVMGYLVITSILGQKIEYRDAVAMWEPLGTGAVEQVTRYWTQSELNSRLIDLTGAVLFNRVWALVLAVLFLGLTFWRFSMIERAPSRRRLRKLAKRQAARSEARGGRARARRRAGQRARSAAVARSAVHGAASDRSPAGADQSRIDRPAAAVRGLHRSHLVAVAIAIWHIRPPDGFRNDPERRRRLEPVPAHDRGLLRRRAGVARAGPQVERVDRFHRRSELGDDGPEDPRDLCRAAARQRRGGADRDRLPAHRRRAEHRPWPNISPSSSSRSRSTRCRSPSLPSSSRCSARTNMSAGASCSCGSSPGSSSTTWATATRSIITARTPPVPLSDFVGSGSFWKGAAVFRSTGCASRSSSRCSRICSGRAAPISRFARALAACPVSPAAPALAIGGVAAAVMLASGAYAYYNIKILNRYETSDQAEKFSADYERKYLKFEKLPQPADHPGRAQRPALSEAADAGHRGQLRARQRRQCADH